ncbi:GNAT family N-acetyltransferase [Candidatus Micrarchaeota archaeon]|nr:GNAT family N-acetyltransferase [Candidatus Micrarchaeota archaeon]
MKKSDVIIRKATLKDRTALYPLVAGLMLHHRLLAKNKDHLAQLIEVDDISKLRRQWFTKHISSKNSLVLVAQMNEEIVGYSLNFIKDNVRVYKLRKLGHVADLYIKKGHRGQGIAKQFKDIIFSWFKKKRIKYLSIATHAENKKAHSIYKKWGFFDYHIEMRKKL